MTRGGGQRGLSNAAVGLLAAALLAVLAYFAFGSAFGSGLPWGGGTEYRVVFDSAQNLRKDTPVRIAGVNVGTVTQIEPLAPGEASADEGQDGQPEAAQGLDGGGAVATLEIKDEGLPLKEDAHFELRPRLFLEGNLFVEVSPGSPGAPEADPDGAPFSPDQTANSVQLDQILTNSLQRDSREQLQVFLDQFGKALIDEEGAQSFRTLYKSSPGAFRYTSQVNEALLGQRPGDLSGLIKNLDRVLRGLGRNEVALQDTITNLRIVTGSFAAESAALEDAIAELPRVLDAADPALDALNSAFPPLRAFSREALPGTRTAPETLDAAIPLLRQVRLISRPSELRGLANDLVPTVPNLARLAKRTPNFLEESRELASCFNEVIIPWSLDEVEGPPNYPYPAVGPVYKETGYGLAGIAGESRSQDANGQYIRIAGGGGFNTITAVGEGNETVAGVVPFDLLGAMPGPDDAAKTPFRPNEPCENQEPPNLQASGAGPPPNQQPVRAPGSLERGASGEAGEILDASAEIMSAIGDYGTERSDGDKQEAREIKRDIDKGVKRFYRKWGSD